MPASETVLRRPHYDLSHRPFIVIWEATRACSLACVHCRAEAIPDRDPEELTTIEAAALMSQIADFGKPPPLFVITGGDPFERPDLAELIAAGVGSGLPVSVSPSGTALLSRENIAKVQAAGAVAISLSIDGASARVHDGFRGIPGVFDRTIAAWHAARDLGIKVQVNTTVTADTMDELPDILRLVVALGAMTWSVFFLVPTGRGAQLDQMTPRQFEDVMNFLYDADKIVSVKATEGHQFRRVVLQRRILEDKGEDHVSVLGLGETYRRLHARLDGLADPRQPAVMVGVRRAPLDVASGRGYAFISHTGEVYPSGFLPLSAGNVRETPLPQIYRDSPLFNWMRDPAQLLGRCGRCEFREVCGGSRSRAYGATGNVFAEEPGCDYEPGSFPYPEEIDGLLKV
jgi:radical SAM protein